MSKNIIISINPTHVKNIISGVKKFEYRTKAAKKDIKKIIIYETLPIKKIVAEAEIIEILEMCPNDLWERTKEYSGITKEFFDEYFKNRKKAYAYRLGKIKVYEVPKKLSDYGVKFAPQSFIYVNC